MEGVVKVDRIFISSDRQDVTFVWMKGQYSIFLSILQACRDLLVNVLHR